VIPPVRCCCHRIAVPATAMEEEGRRCRLMARRHDRKCGSELECVRAAVRMTPRFKPQIGIRGRCQCRPPCQRDGVGRKDGRHAGAPSPPKKRGPRLTVITPSKGVRGLARGWRPESPFFTLVRVDEPIAPPKVVVTKERHVDVHRSHSPAGWPRER